MIGASVFSIAALLTKDFSKLPAPGLVLASVLSWLTMHDWLQAFADRITIPWWIFLLAGVGNLFLAILTVCYHSIKTAWINPVTSLRAE